MSHNQLYFNPSDPYQLCALMRDFGDSKFPFSGTNEDGEDIDLHISKDSIVCKTYQNNGWIRANYYDEDGICIEEMFEGKWQ